MNFFNITDTKFYNELRNGIGFLSNLSDFTNELVGNVGETIQLIRKVTVKTEIIASDFGTISHQQDGSTALFTFSGNWFTEGISQGATVLLSWDGKTATETVTAVTGNLGTVLVLTNTNIVAQGYANEARQDLVILVTSAPNRVIYKYGLNNLGATVNNYISPFDNNEQSYSATVTGSYTIFARIGNSVSWDLGKLEGKYNGTTNGVHEFEFRHTFKVPYYVDGQLLNVEDLITPQNLISTNSLKYGMGLFMSENNFNSNRIFESVGFNGSVGYYNENFNGLVNNYSIQNLTYTNTLNTPTIESVGTNTIEFDLKKSSGNWAVSQKVIFKHSKLPTATEYQNKTDSFNTVWIVDSLEQTEGAGSVNSSIFTNLSFSIDGGDPTVMNITMDISYSASQQLLISNTKNWLLSLIVGDETLNPYSSDRVMLKIDSQLWVVNSDVTGLIQNADLRFYNSDDVITLPAGVDTNFTGWDGDFIGVYFEFQTKAQDNADVKSMTLRLIARNSSTNDWFEINSTNLNMANLATVKTFTDPNLTGFPYQLVNVDYQNSFNIKPNESFNRIIVNSVQPAPSTVFQDWTGSLAFKVNWRDYIGATRPNVFYDATKPQNNLNEKTSNYSNKNGYDIHAVLDLVVGSSIGIDTTYRLLSTPSEILEFDDAGGTGFTAVVNYYDHNGDVTLNLNGNNNVTIEIVYTHSSGTLVKPWGEIWIEAENGTQQEWRLSTQKDWTSPQNQLKATDTLMTGNTTVVEVISTLNQVKLICQTNSTNITPNIFYKIRHRLGA